MSGTGKRWPWAIGTVLVLTMAGNLWVLRLAGSDPSFAVEPDYYRKAVAWDTTMAEAAQNTRLGWQLTVESMATSGTAPAQLSVQLRDREGKPMDGASLEVAATHNARADHIVTGTFADAGGGRYVAALDARRPGLWELRFTVRHGTDRFTARIRHDTARDTPSQ
jgi:nitrogen fixation protein FixH